MTTAVKVTGLVLLVAVLIGISAAWCGFLVMILCGVLWHTFGILKPIGYVDGVTPDVWRRVS